MSNKNKKLGLGIVAVAAAGADLYMLHRKPASRK